MKYIIKKQKKEPKYWCQHVREHHVLLEAQFKNPSGQILNMCMQDEKGLKKNKEKEKRPTQV